MPSEDINKEEAQIAERYFDSFSRDYHGAFGAKGEQSGLHKAINRMFRTSTFLKRSEIVREALKAHGLEGKSVLDVGCGSGELAVDAARMGANVLGLDISQGMIDIATEQAAAAGLSESTEFKVLDVVNNPIPEADVTMMVAVIEYYKDLDNIVGKLSNATREKMILVDAGGHPWRKWARYVLARMKKFRVYYHSPDSVAAAAKKHGMTETLRVPGHSYTVMVFDKSAPSHG